LGIKTIAVCDTEALYVSRFLLAVQGCFRPGIKVLGATNKSSVETLDGEVDLWLLGEPFWEEKFLERHREQCVLLSGNFVPETLAEYTTILKYQSKDQILRELFRSEVWNRMIKGERKTEAGGMETAGIYAPDGGSMQMLFSLAYAFRQAESKKVLYVNLQENSGFYHLFAQKTDAHIGDLICLLRQQKTEPDLCGYIRQFENVSVLLPLWQGMQGAEVTKEDIQQICGIAAKQRICELLVIDWGRSIPGFWDVFSACHTRILVTADNSVARAAKKQFLESMHLEAEDADGRIREFCWPKAIAETREKEALAEELINGSYRRMIESWEGFCREGGENDEFVL
jgi:hypothetical protein